jgi:hypothetical protein
MLEFSRYVKFSRRKCSINQEAFDPNIISYE